MSKSTNASEVGKSLTIAENKNLNKRRRAFEAILPNMPSYLKKPRMIETLLPLSCTEREENSKILKLAVESDLIWMFSYARKIPNTPIWVGFNS